MPMPTSHGRNNRPIPTCRIHSSNAISNNRVEFIPCGAIFVAATDGTVPMASNIQGDNASRQQKIMDFYNRKTVSQRRQGHTQLFNNFSPPINSFLSPTPSLPPDVVERSTSSAFQASMHPTAHVIHPEVVSNNVLLWNGMNTNAYFQATENPVLNNHIRNFEPGRSFVVLQPLIEGMQDLVIHDNHSSLQNPQESGSFQFASPELSAQPRPDITLFANQDPVEESNEADDDDDVEAPELFAEDTTCAICSGVFKDPRILACGHTFCLKCLVQLQKRSRQPFITCPVCREETFVQGNNLKFLTKNFTVRNLVETIRLSSKTDKNLQSQMVQSQQMNPNLFDVTSAAIVEPKESRRFPLKKSSIMGMAYMKHKIYIIYENSNVLSVISTKTFLIGSSKKEETISLEDLINPKNITSCEKKNVLFILEELSNGERGMLRSRVIKVSFSGQKAKTIRWIEEILTTKNIVTTADNLELVLLAKEGVRMFLNFYRAESDNAELSRKIKLDESIVRPVQFTTIFRNSEFYVCHLIESGSQSESVTDHQGRKQLMLCVIGLDGKILRNRSLGADVDLSCFTSDSTGRLFFIENSTKQIFKIDNSLDEISRLKFKNLSSVAPLRVCVIDSKKFIVGFESHLCIYEN